VLYRIPQINAPLQGLTCCLTRFGKSFRVGTAEEFHHTDSEWTMVIAINVDVALEIVA
jgi:hypothetical protein